MARDLGTDASLGTQAAHGYQGGQDPAGLEPAGRARRERVGEKGGVVRGEDVDRQVGV
jgi:hypothetical protein